MRTKIIQFLQQLLLDIKQHHWNTSSYSEHIALDDVHSTLSEHMDSVAEALIGLEGPLDGLKLLPVPSCKLEDIPADIREAASQLRDHAKANKYEDLLNTAADIDAAANRLQFLLRLS